MKHFCMFILLILSCAGCAESTPESSAGVPTLAELPTSTPTPTATETAIPTWTLTATDTPTPTITLTPTVSVSPSATITDTPSPTATNTPTPTLETGSTFLLAQLAAQATILPQTLLPVATATSLAGGSCPYPPPGGFAAVYAADPALNGQLGCAQGDPPVAASSLSALQPFERGIMIWVGGPIYVLSSDGRFQRFDDTFVAGVDPESGGEIPPPGLIEPIRGFGKVWRSNPSVRTALGWGLAAEGGGEARLQRFDRGWMIFLSQRGDVLILIEDFGGLSGTWRAVAGGY